MLAAQRIYGPDPPATWSDGPVALGRSLFSSLDEDVFDRQPLTGGGGRYRFVADLRLDNRAELGAGLGISSPDLARLADADILLSAWEKWGAEALQRIYGDYAFALWDAGERRLFLARDAMSIRPLHYHRAERFFAFASMPKGLHALPEVPYGPDEIRGAEFLALLPEYGERSFFEGISRVAPGESVAVSPDGLARSRHWQPRRAMLRLPRREYVEGLRAELDRAVAVRMRGQRGLVAAHLSAGLDSTGVAATAARLAARDGGRVLALTATPREGYEAPAPGHGIGDESALAAATAAFHPAIDHVVLRGDRRPALDDLDRDFFLFERPLGNACTWHGLNAVTAEAGRRGARILLSGMMGNLTMSYGGVEHLAELVARGRFIRLAGALKALVDNGWMSWRQALAAAFGAWTPAPLWRTLKRAGTGLDVDIANYTLLRREKIRALDLPGRARAQGLDLHYRPWRDGFASRLWTLGRVDWGNYTKGGIAGWGVDVRVPPLDRRLVEYCLAVPAEAWFSDGNPRGLFREALSDRVPREVLEERRLGVQGIDWHESIGPGRFALEVERLAAVPAAAEALDLDRARRLIAAWPEEGWHRHEVNSRYRIALLRGIVSGHFKRLATRSNACGADAGPSRARPPPHLTGSEWAPR